MNFFKIRAVKKNLMQNIKHFLFFNPWTIVFGVGIVLFATAGGRFSFGVFLGPITEDFTWSRASVSGALALAGLITGIFRPIAGILSDRFHPKNIAILGGSTTSEIKNIYLKKKIRILNQKILI